VFYDKELRKIPGTKREEEIGGWRRLHNEELDNVHSSPNIIRVTKSRTISWWGNATCM
jgi:hypothetical protein